MVTAVFIYVAPHIGWSVNSIISSSMEPSLKTGSLVVSRPVNPEKIEAGDIITFRSISAGETIITHRVIDIEKNSPIGFYTKGDANYQNDPFKVSAENLVGEICLHIPYCGYFTEFLKTTVGFFFSIVIPSILVLVMYIVSIWRFITENKKQRANV